jgi:MFS family permease
MSTSAEPAAGVTPRPSGVWRHYGWAQVVCAAIGMVATLPGRTQGLGMITKPLLEYLQLDPVLYAQMNLWGTLFGALFCIPVGWCIDRWGVRLTLSLILFALGLVVAGMSAGLPPLLLFLAILLTRGLGQSALSVASLAVVGKWFSRRIGLAMGVYSVLVGLGFAGAFKLVGTAIKTYGWQDAWQGIGITLIALAPLAWLIVRDSPESCGLPADRDPNAGPEGVVEGRTLGEALRTPTFWVFALASSFYGLLSSGIALFNEAILNERGFSAEVYYNLLPLTTLVGVASNFTGGWASSRWGLGRVLAFGMLALAGATSALPFVRDTLQVAAYAVGMGVAGGIVTVTFFAVWGQAFGRTHLGRIQGVAQLLTVVASAVGPLLVAECNHRFRTFMPVYYAAAPIAVLFAVLAWFTPTEAAPPQVSGDVPEPMPQEDVADETA